MAILGAVAGATVGVACEHLAFWSVVGVIVGATAPAIVPDRR